MLATGGDAFLGGDDWDAALARHLAKHLFTRRGAAATSPAVRARLRAVARAAKEQLSECEAVQVAVPAAGGATFTLTRSALQDVTADLFRRCREPVERACWQAGVDLGALYSEREERARQPVLSRRGDPDAPAVIHTNKARMPISEVCSRTLLLMLLPAPTMTSDRACGNLPAARAVRTLSNIRSEICRDCMPPGALRWLRARCRCCWWGARRACPPCATLCST